MSRPDEPMTQAEAVLLEHRHAVRTGLPVQARHAAGVAEHAVLAARYAVVGVPPEVERAVEALAAWAGAVAALVGRERAEREASGAGRAEWQRGLERRFGARGPESAAGGRSAPGEGDDMPGAPGAGSGPTA